MVAVVLVAKSCPTFWDLMDCRMLGSSVCEISPARILEWLPFPSPGSRRNPGIEPVSPALAGGSFTAEPPGKHECCNIIPLNLSGSLMVD